MATTRQLASYILRNDQELNEWFKTNHGFTREKVWQGQLEDYQSLIGVIIQDGLTHEVITPKQAKGVEEL